jgi:hypothetical protein
MSIKTLIVTVAALTATLGAGLAQAHEGADVQWSVTIGGGAPAYGAPYPVYRQPAPVYRAYPAYPQQYPSYQHPTRWDRDGDGIPNRYDRVYNPRWDRDGDGIPNRYDRDRDGDGIPNWRDHNNYNNRSWGR